ncbi:unnamed protein product [Microthlaspi erraticum]|uniref:Transmembrane protein n=1 Tax=Microthlaspi erraticum TaxID=1685480 RepID=A0A6D2IHG8_9BRAS|nr:unnamed protein product [Microthlaspi erraticum]
MGNKAIFRFLMIFFLGLSHFFFIPSNASRLGSLMERPNQISRPQQDTLVDMKKDVQEKMAMELNDYPGSGANNRHLPRQQFGRGCVVDC